MANDRRQEIAWNHDPPVSPATRPLDILVQLLSEVVLELSTEVRRMQQDRMRKFALQAGWEGHDNPEGTKCDDCDDCDEQE